MHLLILNQYGLPSGAPGITRHGDLGKVLAARGHHVTIVASRFNYLTRSAVSTKGESAEILSGVEFRWLDTPTYRGNDARRVRSMIEFTMRAVVAGGRLRRRPDVVLASSPHLLTGLAGLALALRFRAPFVFEVRDLWPSALVDLGAIRRGGLAHRSLEMLELLMYRAARRIIIVPPLAARRVAQLGVDPAKCVAIPNGADLSETAVVSLPATLQGMLNAEAGREIIMYTGAHGVSNGLQTVVQAATVLRDRNPETYERVAFVFIGEGAERQDLMQAAAQHRHAHMHFHGPIGKDAVRAALARATALLVQFADAPVYEFGVSPNKLFDYMAAAKPVLLGSRLDSTPVDEATAGIRYEPGSPGSLATAIETLVALAPPERAAMGQRGRELVERKYNTQVTAAQLEAALDEVIAESRVR
jgi:glycosyltransferase involved in cell wall biosynthesis